MQINGNGSGPKQMSSLDLIHAGKQIQEQAAFIGLHCPQFKTAFGIRMASKVIWIHATGPKMTPDVITQVNNDLKTLYLVLEGDRAVMYSRLIGQLEKMTAMVRGNQTARHPDGTAVFSDANIETMKHCESTIVDAARIDPIKIQ